MDENYLYNCFAQTGEIASVKVIRSKQTGQPEGYGFLEFTTRAAAERILQAYNGTPMPSAEQNFRLNWATLGAGERRSDDTPDYTIFVGDLAADVSDYMLQETFRAHYPSLKGAKVVIDRITGHSKGYGFVRFGDESEQMRAMTEMNGMLCSTRPMRIGPAATKKPVGGGQQYQKASYQNSEGNQSENDSNNTTIFVGGLDPSVSDDHLRHVFSQFGDLVHVKIPLGKRCGFVQFANRAFLQTNRLSQIRPSGMVHIMAMHKDTRHMDMHRLLKTLTCIMEAILAMGITNSRSSDPFLSWRSLRAGVSGFHSAWFNLVGCSFPVL
ncbi:hypothetical protein F0562_010111 [Nyssa sinensis]|uniref:RRM domain-containing protein n=1 Tax=Nyssa sinensis TaxID=561372 RepID=A0A5J5A167_9ASTE|nr:hypothetical protein F0562_010111 [Nyssa sinensis]